MAVAVASDSSRHIVFATCAELSLRAFFRRSFTIVVSFSELCSMLLPISALSSPFSSMLSSSSNCEKPITSFSGVLTSKLRSLMNVSCILCASLAFSNVSHSWALRILMAFILLRKTITVTVAYMASNAATMTRNISVIRLFSAMAMAVLSLMALDVCR